MRLTTLTMLMALMGCMTVPAAAQSGDVSMAHFVKVQLADVPAFEEASREHMAWHADRNDTWAWATYQAMTGDGIEYVAITPDHNWADWDNPVVDPAEDYAHFIDVAGDLVQSMESMAWVPLSDLSNRPANPGPIVQVYEWEVVGSEEAIMHILGMYKEAVDEVGMDRPFTWYRTISNDGPVRIFIAVYFDSFSELDGGGPGPMEIMAEVHGEYATRTAAEASGAAWRTTGSQIWVMRDDLSYMPGM